MEKLLLKYLEKINKDRCLVLETDEIGCIKILLSFADGRWFFQDYKNNGKSYRITRDLAIYLLKQKAKQEAKNEEKKKKEIKYLEKLIEKLKSQV